MSTRTATRSQTDTYTEVRARYVVQKISDDLYGLCLSKKTNITSHQIQKWVEDLLTLMSFKALIEFEIQIYYPNSTAKGQAFRYKLFSDGQMLADDRSGGIDWYEIPKDSQVTICIHSDKNNKEAQEYLAKRGYGPGKFVEGQIDENDNRTYSKDNFGLKRKNILF